MSAIEPVEIVLDKPRLLKPTMRALRIAETELNRMRQATPMTVCSIDFALVFAYNTGIYPRDLQAALLLGFLATDNPEFTMADIDKILDQTELSYAEINDKIWAAYHSVAGKSIRPAKPEDGDSEKKTPGQNQPTGSGSGPSEPSTLN